MSDSELRKELADERRELKAAVSSLRAELGLATAKGKKVGAGVGVATGAAVVLRVALKLARRRAS